MHRGGAGGGSASLRLVLRVRLRSPAARDRVRVRPPGGAYAQRGARPAQPRPPAHARYAEPSHHAHRDRRRRDVCAGLVSYSGNDISQQIIYGITYNFNDNIQIMMLLKQEIIV